MAEPAQDPRRLLGSRQALPDLNETAVAPLDVVEILFHSMLSEVRHEVQSSEQVDLRTFSLTISPETILDERLVADLRVVVQPRD